MDRTNVVEPAKTNFAEKAKIRRAIEAQGIPYTYIISACFAGYFLPTMAQPGATAPPRDKVVILGDGSAKGTVTLPHMFFMSNSCSYHDLVKAIILFLLAAVFNLEQDIATYTIKTVDDPRTVNKSLYIKPPHNIHSFNDLVALWEKKIDKVLEKIHVPEEHVLNQIQGE